MRESHAAQHMRCFSELDILVPYNLYAVAPWVEKVEKRSRQGLDACVDQCLASGLLAINGERSLMQPPPLRIVEHRVAHDTFDVATAQRIGGADAFAVPLVAALQKAETEPRP